MTFRQLGGLAALGFVATVVVVTAVTGSTSPPRGAVSVATVADYYSASAAALKVGVALAPLAWALLALFGAGLVAALRAGEGERQEGWSWLGLVGVAMQNSIFAAVVGTQAALIALATGPEPPLSVLGGLWAVHNAVFALNGTSLALIMAGFSIGAVRAGFIPRWHAALGLVSAALLLAGTLQAAGVTAVGMLPFAGFLLWLVWLAVLGVRMLATSPRRATAVAAASA